MTRAFFVSDLHGRSERYARLFAAVERERPELVFLGGDLLPSGFLLAGAAVPGDNFVAGFLAAGFARLRAALGAAYPRVFLILGNDDPRREEEAILAAEAAGLWTYAHGRRFTLGAHTILGYACIPPTPFLLKDWERYDVSRHVDPGAVSPEEGWRSKAADEHDLKYGTIQRDLAELAGNLDLAQAVCLFHAPPYQTTLDRAALDGKLVDHVPLDVHIGSIAIRRFIEARQPLVTLHGHVHESARLTGAWMARIGRTICLSAAHDGPELALVDFALSSPAAATRRLL